MIWNKDYETVPSAMSNATEQQKEQIKKALDYAKRNVTDGYAKEDDEFIVITVEGYKCIALITDEWNPIEICERVFPFDDERIYPMQEIEMTVNFKQYRAGRDY